MAWRAHFSRVVPAPISVADVFRECERAIRAGDLIRRASAQDKEFHFQNWFKARLKRTGANFEQGGRNSYPDFRIVATTDGYEVKGLAYPGREATYDSNSQIPTGLHNGRAIYYVFGRYPAEPDGNSYPVLDLVICHGDFLNAHHDYAHKNRSVRGFGTYGDILIRDRKMYVAPTPFGLADGLAHGRTLILPIEEPGPGEMTSVGELVRREAEKLIVGYRFDLQTNEIGASTIPNPAAGREHRFVAYRLSDASGDAVCMRTAAPATQMEEEDED